MNLHYKYYQFLNFHRKRFFRFSYMYYYLLRFHVLVLVFYVFTFRILFLSSPCTNYYFILIQLFTVQNPTHVDENFEIADE